MMQSLEQIAECMRLATGFDAGALRTKKRDTFRVAARQLFCYYARLSRHSCEQIGEFLHMDHSTVSYSASRVEDMRDTDDIIKNYINKYEIMSKNKQVIDLCPPDYDVYREETALRGFMCPKCSGRGYVMDYNGRDPERINCPRCGGSGKLSAKVVIQWEADG